MLRYEEGVVVNKLINEVSEEILDRYCTDNAIQDAIETTIRRLVEDVLRTTNHPRFERGEVVNYNTFKKIFKEVRDDPQSVETYSKLERIGDGSPSGGIRTYRYRGTTRGIRITDRVLLLGVGDSAIKNDLVEEVNLTAKTVVEWTVVD